MDYDTFLAAKAQVADEVGVGRWSNPGDTILDPFGGIMTVPYCSIRQGRSAVAVELNPTYWADGVMHVQGAANEIATPTLFDLDEDAAA